MMTPYLDLLKKVLWSGESRTDRTGTGTYSIFAPDDLKFDLSKGLFPAVTTKKLWFKGVVSELLWIISGDTNIKRMTDDGVHVWDEWADDEGEVGKIYGYQLRHSGGVDQLAGLINNIKLDPYSRRHILSTWNHRDMEEMNLPPCHGLVVQYYVDEWESLHCRMYQRSADLFLGVPWNIASYALLLNMISAQCDMTPGTLTLSFGDAHIYKNHVTQVVEQLRRPPLEAPTLKSWMLWKSQVKSIDDYKIEDFELQGYNYHPSIKAPIAV